MGTGNGGNKGQRKGYKSDGGGLDTAEFVVQGAEKYFAKYAHQR